MAFPPHKTGDITSDPAALYDEGAVEIERKKFGSGLSEDGWAVIIGSVLITAVLVVGFSLPGLDLQVPYTNGQRRRSYLQKYCRLTISY